MKKSIFILAAATMAFTACTSSEDLEQSIAQAQSEIGFSSIVNKESRALSNANFTKFWVYGSYTTSTNATPVTVFNSVDVSGTVGTPDSWTYTGVKRYWIEGANYVFDAYSCDGNALSGHGTATYDNVDGRKTLTLNKVIVNDKYQHDLVYSRAKKADGTDVFVGQKTGNERVPFEFKHILSKVKITFVNEYPEGFKVKVSSVNIENPRFRGTWDGKEWTGQDRLETDAADAKPKTIQIPLTVDETLEIGTAANDNQLASSEIYVLPFNYTVAALQLNFTITVLDENGSKVLETPLKASFTPTWEPGYAYNYVAHISGSNSGLEPIEFTTSGFGENDGWSDGSTGSVNFVFDTSFTPEGK